jgi:hypothetical protein
MQVCGGLTRLRMRPGPNGDWLRRSREVRPVPQAEPLAGTPQVNADPRTHASRKTRPVNRPKEGRLPDQGSVAIGSVPALALGPLPTVTWGPVRVDILNSLPRWGQLSAAVETRLTDTLTMWLTPTRRVPHIGASTAETRI